MTGIDLSAFALIVVAPFVGSFLGVVIRRLPDHESIVRGRSHCQHCGIGLTPRDLIPLASWLAARGRCRHCGTWLGWFYPGVELASVAIALVSLWLDSGVAAWLDWGLGCWLLVLGWIDVRRWVLPDALTLSLVLAGIAAAWWFAHGELHDRSVGAVGGLLFLWAVGALYRRWRGRDGLGFGDAKLFAAGGAWVGASGLPSVLFGAAVAALVVAGGLALALPRVNRRGSSTALATTTSDDGPNAPIDGEARP